VVINDFNIARVAVVPKKTNSKLVVDSHAELPNPIALQCLKPITGQRKITQRSSPMNRPKLSARHGRNTLKLEDGYSIENRLSFFVSETPDHESYSAGRLPANSQPAMGSAFPSTRSWHQALGTR
jgi:hypothetical protein